MIVLMNAVYDELAKAEYPMSARYIFRNRKKSNKDVEFERIFWNIVLSYIEKGFEYNLEATKKYN